MPVLQQNVTYVGVDIDAGQVSVVSRFPLGGSLRAGVVELTGAHGENGVIFLDRPHTIRQAQAYRLALASDPVGLGWTFREWLSANWSH